MNAECTFCDCFDHLKTIESQEAITMCNSQVRECSGYNELLSHNKAEYIGY